MNCPFTFIAENSRAFRSGQIPFGIRKVAERAVNWPQTVCPASNQHACWGLMPLVRPEVASRSLGILVRQNTVIGIHAPDDGGACPRRGCIIGYPKRHPLQPPA